MLLFRLACTVLNRERWTTTFLTKSPNKDVLFIMHVRSSSPKAAVHQNSVVDFFVYFFD